MYKLLIPAAIVALSALASPSMASTEEDNKWVAKCVSDNSKEGVTVETVTKYCVCMNDKMSEDEEQSITEWEKSHTKEQAECDKVAGWK
jgi:hypothetical protein